MIKTHEYFMSIALKEAERAVEKGEVPTGCVIVHNKQDVPMHLCPIIGRAHNQVEMLKDPTAHAEMLAITQAATALQDWRLENTTLYVTKEPCAMCAGAIILARIPTVVFGAPDPKRGGACSIFNILNHPNLNHRCEIIQDILSVECRGILQGFFRGLRSN